MKELVIPDISSLPTVLVFAHFVDNRNPTAAVRRVSDFETENQERFDSHDGMGWRGWGEGSGKSVYRSTVNTWLGGGGDDRFFLSGGRPRTCFAGKRWRSQRRRWNVSAALVTHPGPFTNGHTAVSRRGANTNDVLDDDVAGTFRSRRPTENDSGDVCITRGRPNVFARAPPPPNGSPLPPSPPYNAHPRHLATDPPHPPTPGQRRLPPATHGQQCSPTLPPPVRVQTDFQTRRNGQYRGRYDGRAGTIEKKNTQPITGNLSVANRNGRRYRNRPSPAVSELKSIFPHGRDVLSRERENNDLPPKRRDVDHWNEYVTYKVCGPTRTERYAGA